MKYYSLGDSNNNTHPIAILVTEMNTDLAEAEYLVPFHLDPNDVVFVEIYQNPNSKKTSASDIRTYVDEDLSVKLKEYGVKHVVITDSEYFKAMTGKTKAEAYLGNVLPYKDNKYPWDLLYSPGYRNIFYNPKTVRDKIAITFRSLNQLHSGISLTIEEEVLKKAYYPKTYNEIKDAVEYLKKIEIPLAIDIETYSLKFNEAGIGTISFAWNKSDGICFEVDPNNETKNEPVRELLRELYEARIHIRDRYHNASFDTTVLIYQLYMGDILNTDGLLKGLEVILGNFDCTKIIKYLATNSTAGNELGLKEDNVDFLGDYSMGEDIKDISKIPLMDLLSYNLKDSLATNNTYEKHFPNLVKDDQLNIYETLFLPALRDIVQMQLTGLPINLERVKEVEQLMINMVDHAHLNILNNPYVKLQEEKQAKEWVKFRNSKLKTKQVTIDDYKESFNPNSNPQLVSLLYDVIGLPIIERTKSKNPSTSGDTLKALKEHTADPLVKDLLDHLADLKKVAKILTSFIPAMLNAIPASDGWHYLCGFFNLGGTVSGRLSSNGP